MPISPLAQTVTLFATLIVFVVTLLLGVASRGRTTATRRAAGCAVALALAASALLVIVAVWYFSHWQLTF